WRRLVGGGDPGDRRSDAHHGGRLRHGAVGPRRPVPQTARWGRERRLRGRAGVPAGCPPGDHALRRTGQPRSGSRDRASLPGCADARGGAAGGGVTLSPTPSWGEQEYADWMRQALDLAAAAEQGGDVPIGAVVVDRDGAVVGRGSNVREVLHDPTGHTEVVALREAGAALGAWRLEGCSLV